MLPSSVCWQVSDRVPTEKGSLGIPRNEISHGKIVGREILAKRHSYVISHGILLIFASI